MAKKKGRWFKERTYHLSSSGKAALKPQHNKVAQAGKEIKIRCEGLTGEEFKVCRREVMKEIFPGPEEEEELILEE